MLEKRQRSKNGGGYWVRRGVLLTGRAFESYREQRNGLFSMELVWSDAGLSFSEKRR